MDNWFYWDTNGTGMDFFRSLEYVRGRDPYGIFGSTNTPLTNLLFLLLYYFVPEGQKIGWPDTYQASVETVISQYDLRFYQSTLLLYAAYTVACAMALYFIVCAFLRQQDDKTKNLVFVSCLCCYGMLYSLERGSIALLSIDCLLVYLLYYRSANRYAKEAALVALAVAAGLSLFPVVFVFLLFRHRDGRAAARAILYTVCSVVAPCFAFHGGLVGLHDWLSALVDAEDMSAVFILAAVLLLVSSLRQKKAWMSALCLALASLCLFHSSECGYVVFLIPILCFFTEEAVDRDDMVVFIMTMLMVIPLPLFYTRGVSYPRMAFVGVDGLLLSVWCILGDGVKRMISKRGNVCQKK